MSSTDEYIKAGVTPANFEKCPEARHFEPFDWCKLSENICVENTGNEIFDTECHYHREALEERE